ncbi:MAG: ABC transporter permease, partial [Anaerolineae bacterium]|nr:ABC transporter permease [Anaerolineae bacterium]
MLEQLRFYLSYSINDLRATKRQTVFAVLCIAVGVAAIVSLQTLGVMIQDTFSGSLQESNLADIRVLAEPRTSVSAEVARQGQATGMVSPQNSLRMTGVYQIENWLQENYPGQVTLTYRQAIESNSGLVVTNLRTGILNPLTIPYIVEVANYPLYGTVRSETGRALRDLIVESTDIVISRTLADQLQAEVG